MEEKFKIAGTAVPVKAKVVADNLLEIYREKGMLTPSLVVEAAKNKKSELHSLFEWDDTKAAHKYRIKQATELICRVNIIKEVGEEKKNIRAFVNIRRDEEGKLSTNPFARGHSSFVYVNDAMENKAYRDYTIQRALIELQNFSEKYENLLELKDLVETIKEKIKTLKRKK